MMIRSLFLVFLAFFLSSTPVVAGSSTAQYYSVNGTFLDGFDPVSYFSPSGPKKGVPEHKSRLGEVYVHFQNSANKVAFDKNPEKYIPAYNGYCAYAMAKNNFYKVDPKSFKIIDGKLYLFYKSLFVDTKKKWDQKEDSYKKTADEFWEAHNAK